MLSPDKKQDVSILDAENLNYTIKEALLRLLSSLRDGAFMMNEASSTFNKKRTFEDSTTANSFGDDGVADPDGSIRAQDKVGE